jgi:hypothetical protein
MQSYKAREQAACSKAYAWVVGIGQGSLLAMGAFFVKIKPFA